MAQPSAEAYRPHQVLFKPDASIATQEQLDALTRTIEKMRKGWAARRWTEEETMAMIDEEMAINKLGPNDFSSPHPSIPVGPMPTREDMDAFVAAADKVRAEWMSRGFTEEEIIADIDEMTGIRK